MKLILIRHGESEGNKNQEIYGWTDYPLTNKGLEQVKKMTAYLQHQVFHRLYTSPLIRAKYIAEQITQHINGLSIIEDPQLKEMNYGIFEGQTKEVVLLKYNQEYNLFMSQYETYSIPSGEGYFEFQNRVLSFLEKSLPGKDETFVIVTHGGVIREILTHLLHLAPGEVWNHPIHPGCIVEVTNQKGQWIMSEILQT
ncbi:MAG: hypothetical protein CVU84_09575 [Firmicutes bacterium HGW-Firmicutes-1]|jgi:broad specificity phosphatase PhoE|nr:MAG: hypothetical protein CVU84_09575 [Firmicutes bacterium HGW-Firmicutes-1]